MTGDVFSLPSSLCRDKEIRTRGRFRKQLMIIIGLDLSQKDIDGEIRRYVKA